MQRADFRLGVRDRNSALQPPDNSVTARAARFELVFGERDRFPDIDALGESAALDIEKRQRKFERCRHDADDREGAAVERKRFADNRRIRVETPLPETRADDDYAVVAFASLALAEGAASDGVDTEKREQTWRHDGAGDALGHLALSQI